MSQVCELTGKRPNYGNTRSHANNKSRTRWELNLKNKKYFIPEVGRSLSLMLSTRAIRTIDRYVSFTAAIMDVKENLLSERLQKIRGQIYKARVEAAQPRAPGAKPAREKHTSAKQPEKKKTEKKKKS